MKAAVDALGFTVCIDQLVSLCILYMPVVDLLLFSFNAQRDHSTTDRNQLRGFVCFSNIYFYLTYSKLFFTTYYIQCSNHN